MMKSQSLIAALLWSCNALISVTAFQTPAPSLAATRRRSTHVVYLDVQQQNSPLLSSVSTMTTRLNPKTSLSNARKGTTELSMYNLPPGGGGGGGNNNNGLGPILSGALTIGAIFLFFASPLGGIFFAITNSLFLLALILPVLATIAFQVWQSMNTIEGACPSCGAPKQRVMKDSEQVSFCFNCGAFLQASSDLKSIDLSNPNQQQPGGDFNNMGGGGGSMFDQLFGGGGGPSQQSSSPEQPSSSSVKDKEQKFKRERTVIDVEVSKDE